MTAPDNIANGYEPAVLGASVGALLGELIVSLLSLAASALPLVLAVAGAGALIAGMAAAVARRDDSLEEAGRIMLPGLVACVLLMAAAWAVGGAP